jgi:hypothetical protein
MGQTGGPVQPPTARQFSADGRWFWDGAAWQPAISLDGRWRWNGFGWVAAPAWNMFGLSAAWIGLIAGAVVVTLLAVTVPVVLLINAGNRHAPAASESSPPAPTSSPTPKSFTTIPCDQLEHTQVHYHAFLQILMNGSSVDIPTSVGRTIGCYCWLHMHTSEPGIIHAESPADRVFTLGDFFDVWSDWGGMPQLLDASHVATFTLTAGQKLVVYIDLDDGSGAVAYSGDPRGIVLKDHEIITLEITPPTTSPPPSFTWPPGF